MVTDMEQFLAGLLAVAGVLVAFEYRLRRPEFIVLFESKKGLGIRRGPLYPRHFSLAVRRTTHPIGLLVEATAAGNLGLRIKIVGAVAPDLEHLASLVRVGGWQADAAARSAEEFQVQLQGLVKEFAERHDIQSLSSQKLLEYLNTKAGAGAAKLGLEVVSLAVQSFDPADPQIAEALRQQEEARILEHTERLTHQARIAAAKAKFEADREIAVLDSELELKKIELRKAQMEQDSLLADQRLEDELRRDRKRLQLERDELELLKSSPELLMLTPQAARLAEASQGLKNARTIVSLSAQDFAQRPDLLGVFYGLLEKALDSYRERRETKEIA